MKKIAWVGLAFLGATSLIVVGARGRESGLSEPSELNVFSLNCLDYRTCIFDLRQNKPGISHQIDENYRDFLGDLLFNGEDLLVLENDRYSGHFVLLGEDKKPDNEFNLYHSLRIYKRSFQVRQFPFLDRFLPFPLIEPSGFFGRIREPRTEAKMSIGHCYLLRLFHRTTVSDERVFMLKVIDFTPGVRLSVMWRELELSKEP